ncbi:MAG: glycosyltransferase family 4 protein [Solirubrobacteraceae bacterium]|nr:glycosyltransferase family 4 protein [Solirubrobacteraceae bacterium]
MAVQQAGAEVEVLVLHRPIPSAASLKAGPRAALAELRTLRSQPRHTTIDGIPVTYVRFFAPNRTKSYGMWGKWAAKPLGRAMRSLKGRFDYDLIHAHNAVPAADAVQRAGLADDVPLVTSVHGGDVFHTARLRPEWAHAVSAGLNASDLVLANSSGIRTACRQLTTSPVEVQLLGADVPEMPARSPREHTLITIAHVIPRKRHADVLRAMWVLREDWPRLRYVIVGDGPERPALELLADELGIADRVEFRGQLAHDEALKALDGATLAVMPSIDEAYGVAYVESMAHGVPTIGSLGEPGPLDLADLGSGIQLAAPGDVEHLSRVIDRLLGDAAQRARLGKLGRRVMAENCSWEVVGRQTVRAYERTIRAHAARTTTQSPAATPAAPPARATSGSAG